MSNHTAPPDNRLSIIDYRIPRHPDSSVVGLHFRDLSEDLADLDERAAKTRDLQLALDAQFARHTERFATIEYRLAFIQDRLSLIEEQLETHNYRLSIIENRLLTIEHLFTQYLLSRNDLIHSVHGLA